MTTLEIFQNRQNEIEKNISSLKKTALVVQGGGMRGVYSMAALMALEEIGLSHSFDKVYGSSAGAVNGAYFLAEQAKLAVSVYLDDISNKNFINYFRLKKVVDIDYLVDAVLSDRKKLDVNKVLNSYSELIIVLFNYLEAKSEMFTNKSKDFEFMEALRATAALPILYNRTVKVKHKLYIDGGIEDGVPLLRAVNDGCTDIIVVLTRPTSFRRNPLSFFMRNIETILMYKYPEKTRNVILNSSDLFNKTMDFLENPDSRVNIKVISPSNMELMVSRTTNDRNKLLECALMARNDARKIFNLIEKEDNPFI